LKKILTIAGSDSSGGAGIQADLKTMTVLNVYGATVITAVTAQNTTGVQGIKILSSEFVEKQIDSVINDIKINSVKTGMLANKNIIDLVYEKLKASDIKNIVVDPVMVAVGGDILLEKKAIKSLINKLSSIAKIITPNLYEAKLMAGYKIDDDVDYNKIIKKLYNLGPDNVLIKGVSKNNGNIIDLLYSGNEILRIKSEYIPTRDTHGSGCTLSSAIASYLALGNTLIESVRKSKEFVTKSIKEGVKIGKGRNPLNHLTHISE
jgi:hydroxymethylpyrimidine kinase/phosphomethylpyrimidine kinase